MPDAPLPPLPPAFPESPTPDPLSLDPGFAPAAVPPSAARPRVWLGIVTLLLLGAVVVLQRPGEADPKEIEEAKRAAVVHPPEIDPYILLSKLVIGFKGDMPEIAQLVRQQFDAPSFGEPSAEDQVRMAMVLIGTASTRPMPGATTSSMPLPGIESLEPKRPVGRVLDDVEKNLAAESPLHDDIVTLRPLLDISEREGATEKDVREGIAALDDAARAGLRARHGWYADVLMSAGDDAAPVRAGAARDAWAFVLLVAVAGSALLLALMAGIGLLILAVVRHGQGKLTSSFAPAQREGPADIPTPHSRWARGLWLETLAVFLLGFLALKLVQVALVSFYGHAPWIIGVALGGQWVLLACIFWPLVRGLSRAEWKRSLGWHAPRGVAREMGAGVLAYLAALPLYLAMAVVVVVLMLLTEAVKHAVSGGAGRPAAPPTNRITEIIGSGGPLVIAVVFLLATVWAPIVEESIFRGALYRHLRGRFGLVGAATLSAAAFALMHGYLFVQLLMVFTLGFVFAIMREWRNSLIPSATAHALHNGVALSLMLAAGWFMRG